MTQSYERHDSMRHGSFMRDMTHSCYITFFACHEQMKATIRLMSPPHLYVTWFIHKWHDPFMWRDFSYTTNKWVRHSDCCRRQLTIPFACDLTRSYVTWRIHIWHDSFICDMPLSYVTWLIHMWHDLFVCDMTNSYVTWRFCLPRPYLLEKLTGNALSKRVVRGLQMTHILV